MNLLEETNLNESYNFIDVKKLKNEEVINCFYSNNIQNETLNKSIDLINSSINEKTPSNWKYISETLKENSKQNLIKLHESLLIYTVTWNLKGEKPSRDELKLVLPKIKGKDYHFYVIGTQECMRSIFSSFFNSNKDEWIKIIKEELGDNYTLLKEESLSALNLAIFVHYTIIEEINKVASSVIKTGIGNVVGNKGATAISFEIRGKNFLFINSHFTAGQKSSDKRNKDFNRINNYMSIGKFKPLEGETLSDLFDICIWLGDFNYRLDYDSNNAYQVVYNILNDETYKLLEYDQMSIEIKNERLSINNFVEGLINFNPTYKYHTGSIKKNEYDITKRIPSWTDRIIYKSYDDNLLQCKYDSIRDTYVSDHKPVYSVFRYDFIKETEQIESPVKNIIKATNKSQICVIF